MLSTVAVSHGSITTARPALHLPPRGRLRPTGDDDPLRFYYVPIVGRAYRKRLEMAARFFGSDGPVGCAVEVGYGSGILLPELGRRARRLVGVDHHGEAAAVLAMARGEGLCSSREASPPCRWPARPSICWSA